MNIEVLYHFPRLYNFLQHSPQDYAKAREYFEQAAAKGNAFALSNLGWLYYEGLGVTQDYTKAREYFEKAAEKEEPRGYLSLSRFYTEIEEYKNKEQAFFYGEKARFLFEKISSKSIYECDYLHLLYVRGLGGEIDLEKAQSYLNQILEKANDYELYELKGIYERGKGTRPQDLEIAEKYNQLAIEKEYLYGKDNTLTFLPFFTE